MLFGDDDLRRRAYLLTQHGRLPEDIADELGATVELVERWIAEAKMIISEQRQTHPERLAAISEAAKPVITPERRTADARTLLDPVSGWRPPSVHESPEPGLTHLVTFNDLASSTFSDLVDETVEWLRVDPAVSDVYRADREVIVLSAPRIVPSVLEHWVRAWWNGRLRDEAKEIDPSQGA